MKREKEQCQFFDTSKLKETEGIRKRCRADFIEEALMERFPDEKIVVTTVQLNETGIYEGTKNFLSRFLKLSKKQKGLPPYCEIQLQHIMDGGIEKIIIWSPLSWNDRFAGTAGGGTCTGGQKHITCADNTVRGWTLPYALMNGFTAATADAGNVDGFKDYMVDSETGKIRKTLYENWRAGTTHWMTILGKAIAEILHCRPVKYSYMNGGSGGGRQSLMEAQEYPDDYDGIWASCPAINWTKFVITGLWPIAVMNTYGHILPPKKIRYFTEQVWKSVGGAKQYYALERKVEFDPYQLVGEKTKAGIVTKLDAMIMQKIWDGPRKKDGTRLWYGFRPGVVFWNVGIPVGSFYYSLMAKKPKPFVITTNYARWVTQNRKEKFSKITISEFEELFEKSSLKFSDAAGDKADLSAFAAHGGRLIIDHGLNDPLIPVDGTIDYYKRLCEASGGQENVRSFLRLYLMPGDGHGNCWSQGPGITESGGMSALMKWVEKDEAPEELRAVRVDKKSGELIEQITRRAVHDIEEWD